MLLTDDPQAEIAAGLAKLPEALRPGVRLYLEHGMRPGNFLSAVLCNNLAQAVAYASPEHSANLRDLVVNLWDMMPLDSLGSVAQVEAWIARRGRVGAAS